MSPQRSAFPTSEQETRDRETSQGETKTETNATTETDLREERRHDSTDNPDPDPEIATAETCPECGGTIQVDEESSRICSDCGLVIRDEMIARDQGWVDYESDAANRNQPTGSAVTLLRHDRGLSTQPLEKADRDAAWAPGGLSAAQQRRLRRIRKREQESQYGTDRSLRRGLGELRRMATATGLGNSVQQIASVIYRRAVEDDLLPGRSIEGISSAALYLGIKRSDAVRTADDVVHVSRIGRNRLFTDSRYLSEQLGLEISPVDPEQYVSQIASEVCKETPSAPPRTEGSCPQSTASVGSYHQATAAPQSNGQTQCRADSQCDCPGGNHTDTPQTTRVAVERTARELLDQACQVNYHSGKKPQGVAAAGVYLAALHQRLGVTQKETATAAGVTVRCVRTHIEPLSDVATIEIPDPNKTPQTGGRL